MAETLFDAANGGEAMATVLEPQPLTIRPPQVIAELLAEKGLATEARAWFDLQSDYEDRRAKEAYNVAMSLCQAEMPVVVRDETNTQTHSKYAKLETIKKTCRPIYNRHGFALSYGEADCPLPNHKRTICDVQHNAGHTKQYHIDLPNDGIGPKGNPIGGMNAVQGAISTTSYSERVLTCMVFDITIANTDDDGNSHVAKITEEQLVILNEHIESTGTDLTRFLNWLALDKLTDMAAEQFPVAIRELKRKAAKR